MVIEELRQLLGAVDAHHRRWAAEFADHLSMGDPRPSMLGLDGETCRELERLLRAEWRRRVFGQPVGRMRR